MKNALFILSFITLISCKKTDSLPDPIEAGWKGEKVCEIVHESDEIRVLKCTFKPNVGHEKHYHKPHFGYTLKGSTFKITDKTGTKNVKVPTNYSFSKTEITEHEVLNIGDSIAVFLIVEYK